MQITLKLSNTPPELNFDGRTAHTLTAKFSDGISEDFLDFSPEACFRQLESHLHNNRTYLVSTLQGEAEVEPESAKDDPDLFDPTDTVPTPEVPNG